MSDKLMNVDDVAALLGVSKATISKMMKDRGMPHLKIGKLVRFNTVDVLAWSEKFSRALPTKRQSAVQQARD